ncbi:hypothetical protein KVR01_013123 [Diaporthe batatas]|uniref:uncharacterized protein n=1 Tax=Diaporthe batatas TaxID=748121 RepID=UPI001D049037|nr:uncharacterized protein KVR01_013123 [Diaporthe batatas]KAG8157133.1 hypothetical protein KVR01_013123 [Diaporthe batatas]
MISAVFVTPICLLTVTGLILVARIGVKAAVTRAFELEDGLIITSFMFALVLNVSTSLLTVLGLGRHLGDVEPEHLSAFIKARRSPGRVSITAGICYSMSMILAKAAIMDHYLRVLDSNKSQPRLFLKRALVSLLIVQGVEETLVSLFSCQPRMAMAIVKLDGICFEMRPMWFTGFTLNLIFDLVLVLQPALGIWNARGMSLSEKIGPFLSLVGISLVLVTTVGRAAVVVNISNDITSEADAIVLYSTLPSFFILARALSKAKRHQDKPSSRTRQSSNVSNNRSAAPSDGTGSHELLAPLDPHPGQPVPLNGGLGPLGPTPGERVSWIEKIQAFPVGESSQQEMARRQIGTTSVVEVLPKALMPSGDVMEVEHSGIMVTTTVRRETARDPEYHGWEHTNLPPSTLLQY